MVPVKPIGLNGLQDCCFFFFSGSPFCRTRQRASGGPAGADDAGRAAAARGQEGSAELGLLSPGQASADSTSQAPALIFVVLQILPRDFEAKQLLFVCLFLGSFKKTVFRSEAISWKLAGPVFRKTWIHLQWRFLFRTIGPYPGGGEGGGEDRPPCPNQPDLTVTTLPRLF